MIMRITAKLGKKIKLTPPPRVPADPNPFADWTSRLFVADRAQYILIANTATLYSILIHGQGTPNDCAFLNRISSAMASAMEYDGLGNVFQELVAPTMGRVLFSKALNAGVTGSMNDMEYCAKEHLIPGELAPDQVADRLNQIPYSYIGMDSPRSALIRLAAERGVHVPPEVASGNPFRL